MQPTFGENIVLKRYSMEISLLVVWPAVATLDLTW